MSTKYRFADKHAVYFTTSTVVGWADVFTRDFYREIVLDSIRFCQQNQGLLVHAWVLMTNHLHMICSFNGMQLSKTKKVALKTKPSANMKLEQARVYSKKLIRKSALKK